MRILFVAMSNSIHAARWINMTAEQGWDIHLFPVQHAVIHADFKNVTVHDGIIRYHPSEMDRRVEVHGIWPFRQGARNLADFCTRLDFKLSARPAALANVIRRLRPDMIHSLEIQHAGYLVMDAMKRLGAGIPCWIVSNWGSDIYLFGRLAEHKDKVTAVLTACDYYACECQRDVALAQAFGFAGMVLPVVPNSGGFELEAMRQYRQPGPTSRRRLIVLKGYQNWAGRALVGLRALELAADVLQGYRLVVYSASPDVAIAAELWGQNTGIPVQSLLHSSREQILRLHGSARVSIGLSISDAISTSLLEAIIMGSFPIQSDTSCGDEWIDDGTTGILVHPEDPEAVAAAIRRAVSDDRLVDRAAEINAQVAAVRLDYSVVQPKVIAAYERINAELRTSRREGERG